MSRSSVTSASFSSSASTSSVSSPSSPSSSLPTSAAPSYSATTTDSPSHEETKKKNDEIVVCISDIHGHISKLQDLWRRLEETLREKLASATVIFLGDYCDRGPDTKLVLDWLVDLKAHRKPENTIFLAGNHDFAFGAFLGYLPATASEHFDLDKTTNPYGSEEYWDHKVPGGMQFQGRRWAGRADIYETIPSFRSYGVKNDFTVQSREALLAAVPQAHKEFLQSLVWVHDQPLSFPPYRLICVHAGLVTALPLQPQLESLKNRCLEDESLQSIYGRFDALSGRKDVINMHPELADKALLVSGHHGVRRFTGNRFVLDLSGGKHIGALEALIFSASGNCVVSSKTT